MREKGRVRERKRTRVDATIAPCLSRSSLIARFSQLLLSSQSLFARNPLSLSFGLFVKVVILSQLFLANHLGCFQKWSFFFLGLFLSFSCYTDEPLLTQHSKKLMTSLNSPGPWASNKSSQQTLVIWQPWVVECALMYLSTQVAK